MIIIEINRFISSIYMVEIYGVCHANLIRGWPSSSQIYFAIFYNILTTEKGILIFASSLRELCFREKFFFRDFSVRVLRIVWNVEKCDF